ncbi:hypothetical protein IAQ61_010654 [Plenodomus lingam]|uniref:uncharacterized protein n=1 Tax=Leptosphaeria maculans TaxID=5022 RepID=UPI0033337A4C|nr:hypothetical protein IAQ61_010654 [Plenodomus lingam]
MQEQLLAIGKISEELKSLKIRYGELVNKDILGIEGRKLRFSIVEETLSLRKRKRRLKRLRACYANIVNFKTMTVLERLALAHCSTALPGVSSMPVFLEQEVPMPQENCLGGWGQVANWNSGHNFALPYRALKQ